MRGARAGQRPVRNLNFLFVPSSIWGPTPLRRQSGSKSTELPTNKAISLHSPTSVKAHSLSQIDTDIRDSLKLP
jgi:hypothetical protein